MQACVCVMRLAANSLPTSALPTTANTAILPAICERLERQPAMLGLYSGFDSGTDTSLGLNLLFFKMTRRRTTMLKFLLGFAIAVVVVLTAGFCYVRFGFVDPRAEIGRASCRE